MPQFFTLDRPKGHIAYIRKDGDQLTLVNRNGRQLTIGGAELDPNEFTLTEVPEEVALSLVKPDRKPDRDVVATVIETRSGVIGGTSPASSLTNQDIDDLTDAIDKAIRKGNAGTPAEIRDVIVKALRKLPAVSPNP